MQIKTGKVPDDPGEKVYPRNGERRRTLRIRRSGLKNYRLRDLDRPSVKFAENREELAQAFSLVYQVYLQKGFVPETKHHEMLYSIYSLLPQTIHVIAKSYLTVISNLTIIFDTPEFGLPMDAIYKKELDELRRQGHCLVELSALATPREHRWKNIFLYLVQTMYRYSRYRGVDDVCIAVNPRHKRYYRGLFPFKKLGPERHYPRVDAPAIGLRGKMEDKAARKQMEEICRRMEFDTPFDSYFYFMTGQPPGTDINSREKGCPTRPAILTAQQVRHFIETDPGIVADITPEQKKVLNFWYPGLNLE
ncbi:MAG: N-acyl amino acid synthase FeeM domain-containing protein [Desulfurivibrionaceae bacterium]